jgi:hypothetical protein
MKRALAVFGLLVAFLWCGANAQATDKWDAGTSSCANDGSVATCNQLIHGATQTHDIQATSPTRDEDWYVVETKARRSYEVALFSVSTVPTPGSSAAGTLLTRTNDAGTFIQAAIGPDGPLNYSNDSGWLTLRWIGGAANARERARVQGKNFGNPGGNDEYDISFRDTTYDVARFNNAGGQTTVFLIRNTSPATVSGSIFFYDTAGALLGTAALSVPVNGLQVLITSTVPGVAGVGGSAAIAHTGGYGALSAKSVALEPSTGFSFDTPAQPVPY